MTCKPWSSALFFLNPNGKEKNLGIIKDMKIAASSLSFERLFFFLVLVTNTHFLIPIHYDIFFHILVFSCSV